MRAITVRTPGGPETLVLEELPDPVPSDGEVLIDVAAAGVNRADVSQRLGRYPSPAGAPSGPGLEVSGRVAAVGAAVTEWAVGDEVCALLQGGGYATRVAVDAGLVLPVPEGVSLEEAAALPETAATVWSNLVLTGGLRAGDTLLVHGGSSGIGTTAIQVARALGCTVAVTAGSAAKLAACEALGADILIDYRREDFVERLHGATGGRGADVVLDSVGSSYLERNIAALARHGRILLIGDLSGGPATFTIGALMAKWGSIHGSSLRSRPLDERRRIIREVRESVWPLVSAGRVRPVIDSTFPLADARLAHERMESSAHIGKLLLLPAGHRA
jgi:putative PIG3 family NAD(P)H quinone oxidoreductase